MPRRDPGDRLTIQPRWTSEQGWRGICSETRWMELDEEGRHDLVLDHLAYVMRPMVERYLAEQAASKREVPSGGEHGEDP